MNKLGIIITGTTRGIGKEIRSLYLESHYVISVNRGQDSTGDVSITENEGFATICGNISDQKTWVSVKNFCIAHSIEIDKIFFNAGINIPDISSLGSTEFSFIKNTETNFISIATAINILGAKMARRFIVLSSMSTIFTGNNHIAYSLSKASCELLFSSLNQASNTNKFQILRLGPVKSDFTNDLILSAGRVKKILFKALALNSKDCAQLIKINSDKKDVLINLPLKSLIIYLTLKKVRKILTSSKSYVFPS